MCENCVSKGKNTNLVKRVKDDIPSLTELFEVAKSAKTSLVGLTLTLQFSFYIQLVSIAASLRR